MGNIAGGGGTALIYFWQRYRVLLAERQKHFVEEQQVKAMKKRLEEAENFLKCHRIVTLQG